MYLKMIVAIATFFLITLVIICVQPINAQYQGDIATASAIENSWVEKAPMPTARGFLEVAVVNWEDICDRGEWSDRRE